MSWTHDSIVREESAFWILMEIGILTHLIILNMCWKFHKNRTTNKKLVAIQSQIWPTILDFENLRPQWQMIPILWNHYFTVTNESLSMLFICPRHFEKVKIVSISEILKISIWGVIYRKVRQAVTMGHCQSGEALVNIGQVIIIG